MTSTIQTLPTEVVNLIAAGEVIDSMAAVVRELAENALDAGATRIAISLWLENWRLQVADNGCGMNLEDLQQAAKAHSTSKIRNREDLWKISSLGYRGEALHSIAALATLEIISRVTFPQDAEGWHVTYNNQGEVLQTLPTGIAPGTIVTVSNLFDNWQARRAGMPSCAQQLKAIQQVIQHLALCHPQVTWQVEQNERRWFIISPSETPKQVLTQLLREIHPSDLQYLKIEIPDVINPQSPNPDNPSIAKSRQPEIELVVGLPERCHRRRPDWVKVAVNGRIVRSPEMEQAIFSAFARTLPRERSPVCFLHLKIPPAQIDWNRQPSKAEIYLHNLEFWQEKVKEAIASALNLNLNPETMSAAAQQRVSKLLKASEEKRAYGITQASATTEGKEERIQRLHLKAIAQIHNTYIIAEHPGGLWLIEQHIAHERVLYEQLCERWQLVPLQTPIILSNLTPAQIEQLQRIGIEIDPFGEQIWAARSAPALLAKRSDCAAALIELSYGGDLQAAQVATACRCAIRNGTPLSLTEMQTLLEQWQRTKHPRTCPHGRPIYLSLEESDLSRYFRRHWVIGKSHGI